MEGNAKCFENNSQDTPLQCLLTSGYTALWKTILKDVRYQEVLNSNST